MENVIRRRATPDPAHPQRRIRRLAFTGYRPQKMPFGFDESDVRCVDFKRRLCSAIERFIRQGYRHFISGGAMGMDMYAAEIVQELKERYPGIILEMVSPFDGQAEKWLSQYQKRHDRLFEEADIVTATGHEYTRSCMSSRNRYLVNNADLLLAAYDGQPGGTEMTIRYARQLGVQVCCIRPVVQRDREMCASKKEALAGNLLLAANDLNRGTDAPDEQMDESVQWMWRQA